ncbi:hypothetical protein EDD92_0822 [Streptomyces sp. TLI_185]|nr:hypothetical protein EDD92_0822 [Streptomyces sp. TLI_185]
MAMPGVTTRATAALAPASSRDVSSLRERNASNVSTVNNAHSANSRPLTGAGRAAPRATPTSPPPTQYVSQAICMASSRGADRSCSGREELTAYASSIIA